MKTRNLEGMKFNLFSFSFFGPFVINLFLFLHKHEGME